MMTIEADERRPGNSPQSNKNFVIILQPQFNEPETKSKGLGFGNIDQQ